MGQIGNILALSQFRYLLKMEENKEKCNFIFVLVNILSAELHLTELPVLDSNTIWEQNVCSVNTHYIINWCSKNSPLLSNTCFTFLCG